MLLFTVGNTDHSLCKQKPPNPQISAMKRVGKMLPEHGDHSKTIEKEDPGFKKKQTNNTRVLL